MNYLSIDDHCDNTIIIYIYIYILYIYIYYIYYIIYIYYNYIYIILYYIILYYIIYIYTRTYITPMKTMWGWWPSCSVSLLLPLFVNTAWKPQAVEYQPPQKISDLGMMFNSSQIFNHTGKLKPKRCALSGLKNKLLLMVEVFLLGEL